MSKGLYHRVLMRSWKRWHLRRFRSSLYLDCPDWYRARRIRKRSSRAQA